MVKLCEVDAADDSRVGAEPEGTRRDEEDRDRVSGRRVSDPSSTGVGGKEVVGGGWGESLRGLTDPEEEPGRKIVGALASFDC